MHRATASLTAAPNSSELSISQWLVAAARPPSQPPQPAVSGEREGIGGGIARTHNDATAEGEARQRHKHRARVAPRPLITAPDERQRCRALYHSIFIRIWS